MVSKNLTRLQGGCLCLLASLVLPIGSASAELLDDGDGTALRGATSAAPVAVSVNLLMPDVSASDLSAAADSSEPRSVREARVSEQFGAAAAPTLLDGERGGTDKAAASPSSVVSSGSVGSNSAVDVVTGSNAIREGSFSNASGIPVVIQNTGANVLIQNSTIVNVQLR